MLNSRSVNCRLDSLTITIAKVWGRFHLMQSKKSRISPTGTVELVFCRHFGEMPKMQSVHLDQTHFGYKGQLNRCQAKPLSRHDISIGERLSSHFWRRDLCVSEQNIGHLMVCESEIGFVWQSSLGCLCSCLCGKRIWITHFTQWMKSFVFFFFFANHWNAWCQQNCHQQDFRTEDNLPEAELCDVCAHRICGKLCICLSVLREEYCTLCHAL